MIAKLVDRVFHFKIRGKIDHKLYAFTLHYVELNKSKGLLREFGS